MTKFYGTTAAIVLIGLTAGCNDPQKNLTFEGHHYRTKISKVDKQRDRFLVTVRDVSQSVDGARAAAFHEAVAYCVGNYGSSDISWVVPPTAPAAQLQIVDDTMSFEGTCPQAQNQ